MKNDGENMSGMRDERLCTVRDDDEVWHNDCMDVVSYQQHPCNHDKAY